MVAITRVLKIERSARSLSLASRRRCSSVAALAVLGVVLQAASASAQEVCGDAQCNLDTACATYVKECVPCFEGESSCEVCEPETLFYCAEAECESAADCAGHTSCVESPRLECMGERPSCADGETDDECVARGLEWEGANCETIAPLLCIPRWRLPCQADADCGDGFRCDGGDCTLIDESCSEDTDCPVTWTCEPVNVGPCRPVPGGDIDECVYEQPPVHVCVEGLFAVRESAASDAGAVEGRGDIVPTPSRVDAASSMPSPASMASTSSSSASDGAGCSLAAPRSHATRSSIAGLVGLVLVLAGRVRRRSSPSR